MQINPQRLKQLRKQRQLSRAKLSEISKVSPKQIQRLENPRQASGSVRKITLNRLATALGVKPQDLTDSKTPEPVAETPRKDRISAALLPGVRLAFDLIERRYNIRAGALINMAPLFFVLLAEGSLVWRRQEQTKLQEAMNRVEEVAQASGSYRGSIQRHHFFAQHAVDNMDFYIYHGELFEDPLEYDEMGAPFDAEIVNPFGEYLSKLANDIGKPGTVNVGEGFAAELGAGFHCLNKYSVCQDFLDMVIGSGTSVPDALKVGEVRLRDIPGVSVSEEALKIAHNVIGLHLREQGRKSMDVPKEKYDAEVKRIAALPEIIEVAEMRKGVPKAARLEGELDGISKLMPQEMVGQPSDAAFDYEALLEVIMRHSLQKEDESDDKPANPSIEVQL